MILKYQEWIDDYIKHNNGHLLGKCKDACERMIKDFPELTIVAGHVYCDWGKRSHFWLVGSDNNIIDPTSSQFPNIFKYEPWTPNQEVKIGRCVNCGDEIWEVVKSLDDVYQKTLCSEQCSKEFAASLF